jgi:YVTN family beta-propeller protein
MIRRPQPVAASALLIVAALVVQARAQYVEDSIDVGGAWVGSLAYNSRMNVIYGASGDGILFTISCDSNRLVHSVPLGGARRVVYSSSDNKAYCTADGNGGTVAVIDGSTHEVIRSIPMVGSTSIEWDSVANRIYVSNDEAGNVGVIDCRTDSVIAMIPVPGDAWQLDMNAPGRKLYVRNYEANSLTIINMALNAVIRTLPVGDYPLSGCYCPTQQKYYCSRARDLMTVSGVHDSTLGFLPLPGTTAASHDDMLWVPSTDLVMVCSYNGGGADSVIVLDAVSDSVIAALTVGGSPSCLFWNETSGNVYCGSTVTRSVAVISPDGQRVETTLSVGRYPFTMAASPRNGRVYVGCLGSSHVYVIRDTASAVSEGPMTQTKAASMTASPNPFSEGVRVSGSSGRGLPDEVCVYGRTGEQVTTLRPVRTGTGAWRCTWDGRDALGRPVPAGVYFVRSAGYAARSIVKTGASR